jgi:hypothetical protein
VLPALLPRCSAYAGALWLGLPALASSILSFIICLLVFLHRSSPASARLSTLMTERSLDVWFAHGTVVLRAANVLYRVYAGTLASKASVFADMFQVMGVAGSERIEGCPVVDLHDAPDELSPFLKSLHDARYVFPSSFLILESQ